MGKWHEGKAWEIWNTPSEDDWCVLKEVDPETREWHGNVANGTGEVLEYLKAKLEAGELLIQCH